MDFMDKVSKTVSDVSQKTKDTAEISRLNSRISDNNKRVNQLYTQIGEVYCNLHAQDPEEAIAPYVSSVLDLWEQNSEYNDQIQYLKGFIKCPGCGEFVANTERICPHCGKSLLPDNLMICPSCNATVEKSNTFCPYCGTRLTTAQPEPSQESKPTTKIICKCGAELEPGTKFCPYCGTPVVDLTTPESAPSNESDQ